MSQIRLEKGHYEIPSTYRGMIIKTKYIGPTNYRGSRIKAIHKKDSENTFSKTIKNTNEQVKKRKNVTNKAIHSKIKP